MVSSCSSALGPLPLGQFRIFGASSRYAQSPEPRCERITVGAMIVEYDSGMRVSARGETGAIAAVCLGEAFDVDAGRRISTEDFETALSSPDPEAGFERLYERMFGSFLIVISLGGKTYLYPDAGGVLSSVYSRELQIAGATAGAILSAEDYDRRLDLDLFQRLGVRNEGWFPSGLTAHRGVARLLCNHRLDLETLTAERVWPKEAPQRETSERGAIDRLAKAIRANIAAVHRHFPAALALTAGGDSRALLALSRDYRDSLMTYTVGTGLDVYRARELAKVAGVRHQALQPVTADPEAVRGWLMRCGHAMKGRNADGTAALDKLVGYTAILDGQGAETAKCFFWKGSDVPETTITAEAITRRFGMPVQREIVDATEAWLAGVPKGDAFFTLDLAYQELRNSAWAHAGAYTDLHKTHFSPFESRRTFAAMYALPIATKRADFPHAIVSAHWPEISDLPYNRYGDARDWLLMMRGLRDPARVAKKLRKIFA